MNDQPRQSSLVPTVVAGTIVVSLISFILAWDWINNQNNATVIQAIAAAIQVIFTVALVSLQFHANRNANQANEASREIANRALAQSEAESLRGAERERQLRVDNERRFTLSTLPVLHFSHPEVNVHDPDFTDIRLSFSVTNVGSGLALFTQISIQPIDHRIVDYRGDRDVFALAPGDTIRRTLVVPLMFIDDQAELRFRETSEVGTVLASYRDIRDEPLTTSAWLSGSMDFDEVSFSSFSYVPEALSKHRFGH